MNSNNFDFGGFINDDNKPAHDHRADSVNPHITVLSGLQSLFGRTTGRSVYNFLYKMANRAALENGGEPGLLFTQEGGSFVSFHYTPDDSES
jgi:hypothetical protein